METFFIQNAEEIFSKDVNYTMYLRSKDKKKNIQIECVKEFLNETFKCSNMSFLFFSNKNQLPGYSFNPNDTLMTLESICGCVYPNCSDKICELFPVVKYGNDFESGEFESAVPLYFYRKLIHKLTISIRISDY
jgi:hypothetical protein